MYWVEWRCRTIPRIKRESVPGAGGQLKAPEFYVQMVPSAKVTG